MLVEFKDFCNAVRSETEHRRITGPLSGGGRIFLVYYGIINKVMETSVTK